MSRAPEQPACSTTHQIATAADLRRPGRDRDREYAVIQRDAGSAGAANRDRRYPEGDRQFALGHAAGVRCHCHQRQAPARWPFHCSLLASSTAASISPRSLRSTGRRRGAQGGILPRAWSTSSGVPAGPAGQAVPHPGHRSDRTSPMSRKSRGCTVSAACCCAPDERRRPDRHHPRHAREPGSFAEHHISCCKPSPIRP